jgi:hypothetical protein
LFWILPTEKSKTTTLAWSGSSGLPTTAEDCCVAPRYGTRDALEQQLSFYLALFSFAFRDFLFRSKLPLAEDDQLGKTREFWKLIEQGERTRKT